MAVLTIPDLKTQFANEITTNNNNEINGAIIKGNFDDTVDSILAVANGMFNAANNGGSTPVAMAIQITDTLSFLNGNLSTETGYFQDNIRILNSNVAAQNVFIGIDAGNPDNSAGVGNYAIGKLSQDKLTEGNNNLTLGDGTLLNNEVGDLNIALGLNAGAYELGDNKLYINSDQGNISDLASGKARSLIYGEFAADPENQLLRVNAALKIYGDCETVGASKGVIFEDRDTSVRTRLYIDAGVVSTELA